MIQDTRYKTLFKLGMVNKVLYRVSCIMDIYT